MAHDIIVLGAGMVGTCAALELQLRGHNVVLIDRRAPGQETSYGNAGIIQREAVEPYAIPRDWQSMVSIAMRRGLDVNYHVGALMTALPSLARYWFHSSLERHRRITKEYARLIEHSTREHDRLIVKAGAEDLIRRDGYRFVYRTEPALMAALARADMLKRDFGVTSKALDSQGIARAEPGINERLAGALHWLEPYTVSDPGELVARYAALFARLGGQILESDAQSLELKGGTWHVVTYAGIMQATHVVIALGPWASSFTQKMGYRFPMILKRGYHRHYVGGAKIDLPFLDAEKGYALVPVSQGTRLTTGAEIARLDANPTPRQLSGAEQIARQLLDLGVADQRRPWIGTRPCMADMKPVVGPASRHKGLWFNFGHGHQGLTLGPASARLLADQIDGVRPYIDPSPFRQHDFEDALKVILKYCETC